MNEALSQKIRAFLENAHNPQYVSDQIASLSPVSWEAIDQKKGGLTGFENFGNTCYLNSILQCLRHTTHLNRQIHHPKIQKIMSLNLASHPELIEKITFLVNYIKLIDLSWENTQIKISPISFRVMLAQIDDQFANGQQHDAHELLLTLFQAFHDALSRPVIYKITGRILTDNDLQIKKAHDDWINYYKNQDSPILCLFGGQMRMGLTCLHCRKTFYNFDPLMVLDLPMPNEQKTCDLPQLMDQLTHPEQLSADNLYRCEVCHTTTRAVKKTMVWKPPEVLIIKLNRFQHTMTSGSSKILGLVTYPLMGLDLSPYISNPTVKPGSYTLYAVACHQGNLSCGHYYSIAYHPHQKSWYQYNDEQVGEIPVEKVVTEHAYLLFYQRHSHK